MRAAAHYCPESWETWAAIEMSHRILNVDDTPARLYARTRVLQRSGYEVLEASSGQEALDKASDGKTELLLLDVKLPDMDGFEVCQIIKSNPATRDLPVVQISAVQVSDLDAARGVKSGADFYVAEPVRDEALVMVIDSLLARRRLHRQWRTGPDQHASDMPKHGTRPDQVLATLGHELRDPLQAITSWISVLENKQLTDAERKRVVERLRRAVGVQTSIVNDLLDIARIGNGNLPLTTAPFPLDRAVLSAVGDVEAAILERNIHLSVATDGPVWIVGDAVRLGQVVRNLLTNAIKFTAVGGNVRVSCFRTGDEAEICVADDGEGIVAEFLPHVFDPFRQVARTTTGPQAGLGLGLAIVAHIVQQHGGHISVASEGSRKGATFTVRFPIVAQQRLTE